MRKKHYVYDTSAPNFHSYQHSNEKQKVKGLRNCFRVKENKEILQLNKMYDHRWDCEALEKTINRVCEI